LGLKKILFGVIGAWLCSISICAQQDCFTNFGEHQGIEHPFVHSIVQDSIGYMWIGTTEGLYRFDGQYFDAFKQESQNQTTISDNHISTIYVDPDKTTIWIGTNFGGISRLDLRTFNFKQIQRKPDSVYVGGVGVINAILRHGDWLFIGTNEYGLQVYDLANEEFINQRYDQAFRDFSIYNMVKHEGVITMATNKGIYEYHLSKLEHQDYSIKKASYYKYSNRIRSLSLLNDSTFLICLNKKLLQYNINEDTVKVLFEDESGKISFTNHCVDKYCNIWLGTYGDGLIQLNTQGDLKNWYHAEDLKGTLINNWISSIFFSRQHNMLWVGTKDGLSMLDNNCSKFKQFQGHRKSGRLTDDLFFLFKDSDKKYWWWTYNGFFVHQEGEKPRRYESVEGETLDDDTITVGYEDDKKLLWLATYNGLVQINLRKNTLKRHVFENKDFNAINDIVEKARNELWLVTNAGLIQYFTKSKKYNLFPFPASFSQYKKVKTSVADFDEDGQIWIGDKDGYLILFNSFDKTFKRYSTTLCTPKGNLRYNAVLDVHVKDKDHVWIGTFGTGLLSFNKKTKKVKPVSAHELLNSNVYSIYTDYEGYYWFNTNSKVLRYNPHDQSILSFGRQDGILCREFNEGAHYKTADDMFLMGGFGGFIEFKPQAFQYNKVKPFVEISSYYIEDGHQTVGGHVFYNLKSIRNDSVCIRNDQEYISFYASVLNYQNPEKNMVAWKLEGYDQDWDTLMAYSSKDYPSLPEGKYILKVKGCNNDQVWNDKVDFIHLTVKPTFFSSRLFQAIAVVLFLLLIYLFYKMRTRFLRKQKHVLEGLISKRTKQLQQVNCDLEHSKEEVIVQKKELERHHYFLEDLVKERTLDLELAKEKAVQADRLKTAFLANLSHEIRTPMNAIVGFSNLLASDAYGPHERQEFAQMVQKSSDSLLVLINDIIDISRIETGQVQLIKRQFVVKEHCSIVFKTIAYGYENNKVKYQLDIDSLSKTDILHSDPERLKQILNNLLSNAIKYTSVGHVKLQVLNGQVAKAKVLKETNKQKLPLDLYLFTVQDTGIGIDKEHHECIFSPFRKIDNESGVHGGIGLGLSIVKQLVEMLGGEIWIKSQLGQGTTFSFYIPKEIE